MNKIETINDVTYRYHPRNPAYGVKPCHACDGQANKHPDGANVCTQLGSYCLDRTGYWVKRKRISKRDPDYVIPTNQVS